MAPASHAPRKAIQTPILTYTYTIPGGSSAYPQSNHLTDGRHVPMPVATVNGYWHSLIRVAYPGEMMPTQRAIYGADRTLLSSVLK